MHRYGSGSLLGCQYSSHSSRIIITLVPLNPGSQLRQGVRVNEDIHQILAGGTLSWQKRSLEISRNFKRYRLIPIL